jgi:DNA-binding CsgD family transcriptional regulator
MSETLKIFITTVSILAGLFSIFAVHLMSQKYRLQFLPIYFYFLIFLNIFGIYGIAGARIIRGLLVSMGTAGTMVEHITLVSVFLGLPFLILAMYMFLRLCCEMVRKSLPTAFNLIYFLIQFIIYLACGLLLVLTARSTAGQFGQVQRIVQVTYSVLFAVNSILALVFLFINQRRLIDINEKKSVRIFGFLYLAIIGVLILLVNLSHLTPWLEGLFLIFLFASHLIAIFFLNIYLDKFVIEPVVVVDFNKSVNDFVTKYGISGREKEIIELICMGKSNQDISESLFISLQTVKDHIHRIYLKTAVRNRVQLANLIRKFQ